MSGSEQPSSFRAASWSARIADRYGCEFDPHLVDWFDAEVWKQTGGGEFHQPVSADQLLKDAPDSIWPGLMPCDMLPLIGNADGDWLCGVIDERNRVCQVVQWYHGGGDWLPWGRSIADAIVFDALGQRLPGLSRRYASPAEPSALRGADVGGDPLLDWALGKVAPDLARLVASPVDAQDVASILLRWSGSEIAIRCELVQASLAETVSATVDPRAAQQLGVEWNQVVQWMFDTERMPAATRERLQREYGLRISKPQDWQAAHDHARAVVALAPDLAWAWDVIGYAAEKRGDQDDAVEAYERAAQCSVFTDQSVRLRTHWTADHAAKFSASRLRERFPEVVAASEYLQILCDEPKLRRRKLTEYWVRQALASQAAGQWSTAHRQFVASGWDLGAESMSTYAELLPQIARAAEQSGQSARAELARVHRRCLKVRYGI